MPLKQTIVFLMLLMISLPSFSQKEKAEFKRQEFDAVEERSKLKYSFIPLPAYDPSTKLGLNVFNMFNFYTDKTDTISPASNLGVGGQFTTNGSWLLGLGGTLYLRSDNWRINPQMIYGKVNQELELGYEENADVKRTLTIVNANVYRHLAKRVYVGLGFSYRSIEYNGRDSSSQVQLEETGYAGKSGNMGLKYFLLQDKRDNPNYPYEGYSVTFRSEQYFENDEATPYFANYVDWRHYINLGDVKGQHMLAYRFLGRFLAGDPQQQNYSYYGRTGGDIERGYETGKYIDKNLVNVEVEYRLETALLENKLGFTGFTGAGKVYGDFNDFNEAEWLPMVGVGVRYRILPYERLNVRFDTTVGKEGMVFYFGVRESF